MQFIYNISGARIMAITCAFFLLINYKKAHAGIEGLYRVTCIPEFQYFALETDMITQTQFVQDLDNKALYELWKKHGIIYITERGKIPFEEANSYELFCDVGKGITFSMKIQYTRSRCYGATDQELKVTYGSTEIYDGEVERNPCDSRLALGELKYADGDFSIRASILQFSRGVTKLSLEFPASNPDPEIPLPLNLNHLEMMLEGEPKTFEIGRGKMTLNKYQAD